MAKNWLEKYGIVEVLPVKKPFAGDEISRFGLLPAKEGNCSSFRPRLPNFPFKRDFYIRPLAEYPAEIQTEKTCERWRVLFELIEKVDLIQTLLSPLEIHLLNPERFRNLMFMIHPYDKQVAFDVKRFDEMYQDVPIANRLLLKALETIEEPISLYRRVEWNCRPLSFEVCEDYGNLVMAGGRYFFVIGEKKLDR